MAAVNQMQYVSMRLVWLCIYCACLPASKHCKYMWLCIWATVFDFPLTILPLYTLKNKSFSIITTNALGKHMKDKWFLWPLRRTFKKFTPFFNLSLSLSLLSLCFDRGLWYCHSTMPKEVDHKIINIRKLHYTAVFATATAVAFHASMQNESGEMGCDCRVPSIFLCTDTSVHWPKWHGTIKSGPIDFFRVWPHENFEFTGITVGRL